VVFLVGLAPLSQCFTLVEFKPQLEGDVLLRFSKRRSLWLEGMFEVCVKLVDYNKR
jgi:hypothetical protein